MYNKIGILVFTAVLLFLMGLTAYQRQEDYSVTQGRFQIAECNIGPPIYAVTGTVKDVSMGSNSAVVVLADVKSIANPETVVCSEVQFSLVEAPDNELIRVGNDVTLNCSKFSTPQCKASVN